MSTSPKLIAANDRVMAKELVDYFAQQQIDISYAYARALVVACPSSIRKRYVRAHDAWTWWVLHPEFLPFSERGPRMGETRSLAETAQNS